MWRVPLLLFFALTALACSDQADERILSWHSKIVVEKGGDLLVTETIRVRAEGTGSSGGFTAPSHFCWMTSSGHSEGLSACHYRSPSK